MPLHHLPVPLLLLLLLGVFTVATLAAPLAQTTSTNPDPSWKPAPGSTVTCDKESDKIIGFLVGPQMETVLTDACAAMMPPCAWPDRLPVDTVCPQVMDWKLDGAKSSIQHANVESANDASKLSGWDVKFSVTPSSQPADPAGPFWTKADCYGYFEYIVKEQEPVGCHNSMGSGIGTMTVGATSLQGAVFNITIVKRE